MSMEGFAFFERSSATQTKRSFRYLSVVLFVLGVLLHWLAVQDLWGLLGVLLTLAFCSVLARGVIGTFFARNASSGESPFWFFVALYTVVSGFARASANYFNSFNEIYQNESDAWTIFVLSSERFGQHLESLSRITDTGGAISIFALFYDAIGSLGIQLTPGIGIAVNVASVAFGATVGVAGIAKIFQGDQMITRVAVALFSTSGIAFIFAGLHLRDAFLFSLASLLFYVLVSININKIVTSVLPGIFGGALIVWAMTYFRGESSYVFFGFLGAIALDFAFRMEGLVKYVLLAALGAAALYALILFSSVYADQIEATQAVYESELGQSGGLAAEFVVNQNIVFRFLFGSLYLTLLNVPFFAGFLKAETYYWFIGVQSVQALVALPCAAFALVQLLKPQTEEQMLLLRRVAVFYLLMLAVICQTTLGYRHIGQFLASLYALVAVGYCQSGRTYKWLGALFIASALPAAWLALKF